MTERRRYMNRYVVDTEADFADVRDALTHHITMRTGHVVYINHNESLELKHMAARPVTRVAAFWSSMVAAFAAYGLGHALKYLWDTLHG